MYGISEFNLVHQLGLIRIPSLIIHGDQNKMIHVSFASMMADGIRNSTLLIMERKNHWLHLDSVQEMGLCIHEFVEKI